MAQIHQIILKTEWGEKIYIVTWIFPKEEEEGEGEGERTDSWRKNISRF